MLTDAAPTTRKTAIIDRELLRLRIDIAALQETRLLDEGSLRETNYTFFWKGNETGDRREHGVGFAIRNNILNCIESPVGISKRIMTLRLTSTSGPVTLVSAYAPTLQASSEVKDKFYDDLRECLRHVRSTDKLMILGDFNARIGSNWRDWPDCVGSHGIGNQNENGQRLLELCAPFSLCVTNTYFRNKQSHKVTWKHPRSGHWHQLDFIITRRRDLRDILNARSYQSAICDTDHSLVMAKTRFMAKRIHFSKSSPRRIKINTKAIQNSQLCKQFAEDIKEKLNPEALQALPDVESTWNLTKEVIAKMAFQVFGKETKTPNDWFAECEEELRPYIEVKRRAHLLSLNAPEDMQAKIAYGTAKAALQRVTRICANNYWTNLCRSIEHCQNIGDYRGMYQGIKVATGPTVRKRAAIKDFSGNPITDKIKQLERWVEHYSNLYSVATDVAPDALDALPTYPVMLELDIPPTFHEFQLALDGLKLGKSTGRDNLPAEVVKLQCVASPLFQLLQRCWKEHTIPQDMKNADIVTLYKGKGDRGDCSNHRGISLLSIAGKAFARVVLKRLETLANRIYPETQCGFRAGRSTNDMIFTLRQLQEKCREQGKPLYMAFVDLNKAFDTVSRAGLYNILSRIGCPPTLLSLIKAFHDDMKGFVVFDGDTSSAFNMKRGVRQGCVLAPTLFGIFFSVLLMIAFKNCDFGVHLHTRRDGRLFHVNLLKYKKNRYEVLVRELLYADDAALVANSEEELQELVERFSHACKVMSMSVNSKKTVVMTQGNDESPNITLNGVSLRVVDSFSYLGSTTASNLCNDKEINTRIGRASATFGKLLSRVWQNNKLTIATKVLVYKTCVLGTLLYASETWTTYSKQERRLNAFHMRCLRTILGVTWRDRMTNEAVLTKTKCNSIVALLKQRRLRWLGHVYRMDPDRLPREILLGQIANAKRPVGRPMLRFKDSCKRDMLSFGIQTKSWETRASMRPEWHHDLFTGISKYDRDWFQRLSQRKLRVSVVASPKSSRFTCDKCGRRCHAAIGLRSHKRRCGRARNVSNISLN